jgi:hypothetical protein
MSARVQGCSVKLVRSFLDENIMNEHKAVNVDTEIIEERRLE